MKKVPRYLAWVLVLGLSFTLLGCGGGSDSTPAPAEPVVTTLDASNVTTNSAQLNGTVNPNGRATEAWFEYGLDNTLAGSITTTAHQNVGSGTVDNAVAQTIAVATDNTIYFRVVAVVSAGGTEQRGAIKFFNRLSPPPNANAGPDQSKVMGQTVTLDGSGSSAPAGVITTYLWEQVAGTTVTLSDNGVVSPTFTAPTVTPPGENLQFQLTITDSRAMTSQDNVTVTDLWGAADDFSTDPTAPGSGYTFEDLSDTSFPGQPRLPEQPDWSWDDVQQRLVINAGDNAAALFSHDLPAPTDNVVFSFDFYPIANYPEGGGVWVRLMEDGSNYYELASFDWINPIEPPYFRKVVGGVTVDNVTLPNTDSSNYVSQDPPSLYHVVITVTPSAATINWDNVATPVTFTDNTAIDVALFEIQTNQQDADYDNIMLVNAP